MAGCTIASLHPDPLATFSSSIVSLDDSPDSDDDDDDDDEDKKVKEPSIPTDQLSKEDQFNKYAEAYYSTLFVRSLSVFDSTQSDIDTRGLTTGYSKIFEDFDTASSTFSCFTCTAFRS